MKSIRFKLGISFAIVSVLTLLILSMILNVQFTHLIQDLTQDLANKGVRPDMIRRAIPGLEFLQNNVQNAVRLTALGAAGIAILASAFFSEYLTRPIRKLIEATQAIAKGDYSKRVQVESNDELGELSRSLNTMASCLQEHQELQKRLIADVSHELATPLTNLKGYLEALNDGLITKKNKCQETYGIMHSELERLENMLAEVRTLAEIQQPKFKLHKSKVDIAKAIQKIITLMQPQLDAKKQSLTFSNKLKRKTAQLDEDKFMQIISNLLNNAHKYSGQNTSIRIQLENTAKGFTLVIEDEGQGIPAKDLPYIFERFYRTDDARSRKQKNSGTGLGLSIVKELVESHGGTITVESKEKKGSKFIVEL